MKAYKQYTVILILTTGVLRLMVAHLTGLGPGESYYAGGLTDFHWSYFDQPPLFFWLSKLSTYVFGMNNFGVRFPAVILFCGSLWLMFLITSKLFSEKAGFFAVLTLNIAPVFTIPVAAWFQPDAPLMFFWLAASWLLVKIFFDPDKISNGKIYLLWMGVGFFLGLATLSKYHSALLLFGTFLFVVFNSKYRKWLLHPGPYLAIVICLIISLPIFIWNAQNDWVSFIFQGGRSVSQEFNLHPVWLLRSIGGQMIWLSPWLWLPLMMVFVKALRGRKEPHYGFIFWTAVLPITIFTMIALWSDTQYHFHWQAPGYLMLFILLGERIASRSSLARTRIWLISSISLIVILVPVILIQTETGFLRPLLPADEIDKLMNGTEPTMEGKDFTEIMDRFKKEGWLADTTLFVGSTRWWQAGKIDWALKMKKDVLIFSNDVRNYAYFTDPNKLLGKNAIIVTRNKDDVFQKTVAEYFDHYEQLEDIESKRNGFTEVRHHIYKCYNFHKPTAEKMSMPVYRQLAGQAPY